MSLINDALRKSTRQLPSSPLAPHKPGPADPRPSGPRRKFSLWIPLGFVAVILVFIGIRSVIQGASQKGTISQTQLEQPTLPTNPTGEEAALQQAVPIAPQQESSPSTEIAKQPSASLRQPFTLNGVVTGGDAPFALINNRVVQKGEEIDGYVLKEVLPKKVILEKNGELLELRLQ